MSEGRMMAIEEHSEVERKYDVDPSPEVEIPDLSSIPGVFRVAPPIEVEHTATYFDTPDLRLFAAQVTLRRRTGGLDDGWHLKLPEGKDRRTELRLPLGDGQGPPKELLDRVRVLIRDTQLEPSAVLLTLRRVHRLLGDDDVVLAEVCDDRVTATTSSDAPTVEEWREWEVELVDAPSALLDAAEPLLIDAGARLATASSKVARVLAESLPTGLTSQDRRELVSDPTAGQLFAAYVAGNFARLQRQDQRWRSGDEQGIHQLRVATRRLRSALATYSPILEPRAVLELRTELRWFASAFSDVRDTQVQQQRLTALVHQQPAEVVLGPVVERISDELQERSRVGRLHAAEVLDGERYFRLLDRLETFLEAPPFTGEAQVDAREVVPELVQAALTKLRKRDHARTKSVSDGDRNLALHEVRKSAKRLRYAAETAQPIFGKRATKLAARAKAIQELLGEHQDSVVSRTTLREVGDRAHEAGENTFTFGLLYAVETCRAAELERRAGDALADLPRKDLGAWLRK